MHMEYTVGVPLIPLYTGPDEKAGRADELLHGMGFDVLEDARGFWRVRTEYRYEGWLLQERVRARARPYAPDMQVLAPACDILEQSNIKSPVLATLPRGARLCAQGAADEAGWQHVALADGRMGFAMAANLAPYPIQPVGQGALRQSLVDAAAAYLGTQYRWGGKTPAGIDCSGLTSMVYLMHGIMIYRDASIEPGFAMRAISLEETRPGDLLFFPGHVAMCVGGKRFIHATSRPDASCVVYNSLEPGDPDYLPGLVEKYLHSGTVFA